MDSIGTNNFANIARTAVQPLLKQEMLPGCYCSGTGCTKELEKNFSLVRLYRRVVSAERRIQSAFCMRLCHRYSYHANVWEPAQTILPTSLSVVSRHWFRRQLSVKGLWLIFSKFFCSMERQHDAGSAPRGRIVYIKPERWLHLGDNYAV